MRRRPGEREDADPERPNADDTVTAVVITEAPAVAEGAAWVAAARRAGCHVFLVLLDDDGPYDIWVRGAVPPPLAATWNAEAVSRALEVAYTEALDAVAAAERAVLRAPPASRRRARALRALCAARERLRRAQPLWDLSRPEIEGSLTPEEVAQLERHLPRARRTG